MTITLQTVQNLAPDQASLNAAKKLLKPAKWPLRQQLASRELAWGHCQGSGANPYYIVIDTTNHGYKCSCPSRKFPCKHVLALMWQYADDETVFTTAEPPQWINEWLSRRRNKPTDSGAESRENRKQGKGARIELASDSDSITPATSDSKKQSAAAKRAIKARADTDKLISAGLKEYEQWLNDQLRTGLLHFLDHARERCRNISARLVDAKATTLAARLDELPGKLMHIPRDNQLRVATNELGKIAALVRAWQVNPNAKDVRRAISSAENRDHILNAADTIYQQGIWQVVAEQIESRRDGLISHATWLSYLGELTDNGNDQHQSTLRIAQSKETRPVPIIPFALLQDYYPASSGRRDSHTVLGSCLFANIAYYPGRYPLRAVCATQQPFDEEMTSAMATLAHHSKAYSTVDIHSAQQHIYLPKSLFDFYHGYQQALAAQPWLEAVPFLLPAGKIHTTAQSSPTKKSSAIMLFWQADEAPDNHPRWQLPLRPNQYQEQSDLDYLLASPLAQSFILWDGVYATFGSGYHPTWGQVSW